MNLSLLTISDNASGPTSKTITVLNEVFEVLIGDHLFPWEGFLYHLLEACMHTAEGKILVTYSLFEIIARKVTLAVSVVEVENLPDVVFFHDHLAVNDG